MNIRELSLGFLPHAELKNIWRDSLLLSLQVSVVPTSPVSVAVAERTTSHLPSLFYVCQASVCVSLCISFSPSPSPGVQHLAESVLRNVRQFSLVLYHQIKSTGWLVHVCVCVSVCVNQLHDIFNGKNTRSMAVAQKWIMLQFVARKVLGNW